MSKRQLRIHELRKKTRPRVKLNNDTDRNSRDKRATEKQYDFIQKEMVKLLDIPTLIKVARDVDLVDGEPVGVFCIIPIEKMNSENYNRLFPSNYFVNNKTGERTYRPGPYSFDQMVVNYACDHCRVECNAENPIYTNHEYLGVDICTKCITKAWNNGITHIPGWRPGPVYSLKEIVTRAV